MHAKNLIYTWFIIITAVLAMIFGIIGCKSQWTTITIQEDNSGYTKLYKQELEYCDLFNNWKTYVASLISMVSNLLWLRRIWINRAAYRLFYYVGSRARDVTWTITILYIGGLILSLCLAYFMLLVATWDRLDSAKLYIVWIITSQVLLIFVCGYHWDHEHLQGSDEGFNIAVWRRLLTPNIIVIGMIFTVVGCSDQYSEENHTCSPTGNWKILVPFILSFIVSSGFLYQHINQRTVGNRKMLYLIVTVLLSIICTISILAGTGQAVNNGPFIIYIIAVLHMAAYMYQFPGNVFSDSATAEDQSNYVGMV